MGSGCRPSCRRSSSERLGAAGAPNPIVRNIIGYGMGAPTVLTHGSEEQQDRYLRPLFTGEEVWCQLFSEPGAGSDVASLAMRAVRDGDEWIVNGQKVWTTLAHLARWGMLIARTDPDAPKHKGMTYFVVDMQAPGVEVRPLFQITGEAEFNEVYFTDVRIPDSERLGDVGEGWRRVAHHPHERARRHRRADPPRGGGFIGELVKIWRDKGLDDPATKDRLMQLWVKAEVLRLTNVRASQLRARGTPGPGGLDRQGHVGRRQQAHRRARRRGARARRHALPERLHHGATQARRPLDNPQQAFLRARANSIEGGTSEIMRNILGERVLGLPGDVRTDKELPWSQVPRS